MLFTINDEEHFINLHTSIRIDGSTDYTHGNMKFTINGEEYFIDQNTTSRHDGVLVYESEYRLLNDYTVTFSQHIEECVMYCFYYLPFPPRTDTPPATPSFSPTASPEAFSLDYILRDDNCNFKTRCNVTITDEKSNILVTVLVTNFTSFKDEENGGEIHIINGGIYCNQSFFDVCESSKAGGAIYIHNDFDHSYGLDLLNLSFIC